jgi:hypothetical protein
VLFESALAGSITKALYARKACCAPLFKLEVSRVFNGIPLA